MLVLVSPLPPRTLNAFSLFSKTSHSELSSTQDCFPLDQALEPAFSASIHALFVEVLMRSTVFSLQRPLLFQTSEDIVNNPSLGESLPYSVVLHYLFSRAPNELKYPHEVGTIFRQLVVVVVVRPSVCLSVRPHVRLLVYLSVGVHFF